MVALFVILTIVAFLLLDALVLWTRRHRAAALAPATSIHPLAELLPEPELPGGVFLSPAHLWVGLLPAGLARVGLDPLIRAVLGKPDRVAAPTPGTRVQRGDPLFSARWGSRSILFRSPLAGTVQAAAADSAPLDEEGWVLTVEPAHAKTDLGLLPLAEEARRWFAQEWSRLREFITVQSLQAAPATLMPDGGSPAEGWMRHEPEATWDKFVESFLTGKDKGQA